MNETLVLVSLFVGWTCVSGINLGFVVWVTPYTNIQLSGGHCLCDHLERSSVFVLRFSQSDGSGHSRAFARCDGPTLPCHCARYPGALCRRRDESLRLVRSETIQFCHSSSHSHGTTDGLQESGRIARRAHIVDGAAMAEFNLCDLFRSSVNGRSMTRTH